MVSWLSTRLFCFQLFDPLVDVLVHFLSFRVLLHVVKQESHLLWFFVQNVFDKQGEFSVDFVSAVLGSSGMDDFHSKPGDFFDGHITSHVSDSVVHVLDCGC